MRSTTKAPADPLARRRRFLLAVVALALGLAVGGGTASLWVTSPQERLAETAAPDLSVLTVPVERRVLETTIVTQGDIAASERFEVTAAAPAEGAAIVTAVRVAVGDRIEAGDVLLEVSARPIFALPGNVPAYRDLKPGAKGEDVAQLQAALRTLGHDPGERDGYFGPGTKRALAEFFDAKGFEPRRAGDPEAVTAAERRVTELTRAQEDAAEALDAAESTGDAGAVADAERALDRAGEDLAAAEDARDALVAETGPMLALSEVVFLPSFPARIEQLSAAVGATPGTPTLAISAGPLAVAAELSASEADTVTAGMPVTLTMGEGVEIGGEVVAVAPGAAESGTGRGAFIATVEPDEPIPVELAGRSALAEIEVSTTDAPVLVVPIAAIYATADGSAHVLVVAGDGAQTPLDVTLGMSSDGYVEVEAPGLSEGDDVRVGVTTMAAP